jgi:hypothetical protein
MPSEDQDWLKVKLAEAAEDLRQFGWTVEMGSQRKTSQEFAHARRRNPRGIDEAMVTARFGDNGWLELKRYALPRGMFEWIDRPTYCQCDKKIHRSGIRAQAFARRVAQEAGTAALQREYRCDWNPRAFHLSSKRNSKPIPGAYVVLTEGWNG